jgi:ferredoxin
LIVAGRLDGGELEPDWNPEAKILEAAEDCPVSAIFVEDAPTGIRLFP